MELLGDDWFKRPNVVSRTEDGKISVMESTIEITEAQLELVAKRAREEMREMAAKEAMSWKGLNGENSDNISDAIRYLPVEAKP